MTILIYKDWELLPDSYPRPFKPLGRFIFRVKVSDIKNHKKFVNKWNLSGSSLPSQGKYLAVLKDNTGYENAIIGDKDTCYRFIKDCLGDVGLMGDASAHRI